MADGDVYHLVQPHLKSGANLFQVDRLGAAWFLVDMMPCVTKIARYLKVFFCIKASHEAQHISKVLPYIHSWKTK